MKFALYSKTEIIKKCYYSLPKDMISCLIIAYMNSTVIIASRTLRVLQMKAA